MAFSVVHNSNKQQITNNFPYTDGTHGTQTAGYVQRRTLLCFGMTAAQVATAITNSGVTDSYVQDGEYELTPCYHESLTIYNTRWLVVKYTAS